MRWQLFVISLLGHVMVSGSALAASPSLWQGQFFVTSVTPACGTSAYVGEFGTAVYRPKLGPNDFSDGLAMFFGRYAVELRPEGGDSLRGETLHFSSAISSRGNEEFAYAASFLDIYPPTITAATGEVVIKGRIDQFFQMPGCAVNIAAALALLP